MPRTPKGQVTILDKKGWIQLRWRYQGKRYYLSPGLSYSDVNVQVAQQRAAQIQLDIVSGNFDTTLQKYKPESEQSRTHSAVGLVQKFINYKSKLIQPRSLAKYKALVTWLREYYGNEAATNPNGFIDWLLDNMEPSTAKERLGLLKAAWTWGIDQELVTENPWTDIKIRVKPKQKPQPFSQDEVKRIIQAFRDSEYYKHYADYVQFKFQTGCRTGEVNGLRWRHLNEPCTVVWFGESHTHGEFKDTKTGKTREVKLSNSTANMLRNRRPAEFNPDDLVFPSPRGGPISEHSFSREGRGWRTILEECKITKYRTPYNTRHTFVSHALETGMNPVEVAAITGHDVETLYKHYAGLIKSTPRAPDLFT